MKKVLFQFIFRDICLILYYLAPIKMMINLYRDKRTRVIPFLLFYFNIFASEFFIILGIDNKDKILIVNNVIGLCFNLVYSTIFISFLKLTEIVKCIIDLSTYCAVALVFYSYFVFYNDQNNVLNISIVFNVLVNISLIQKVYEAIKKHSREYLCIYVLVGQILRCGSALLFENFIENVPDKLLKGSVITNTFGLIVGLGLLIIWFVYLEKKVGDEIPLSDSEGEDQNKLKDSSSDESHHREKSNIFIVENSENNFNAVLKDEFSSVAEDNNLPIEENPTKSPRIVLKTG